MPCWDQCGKLSTEQQCGNSLQKSIWRGMRFLLRQKDALPCNTCIAPILRRMLKEFYQ